MTDIPVDAAGSQAKNKPLMQLLASVCNVAVFIPPHPSAAVVMGAAMMGRCAANISAKLQGKPIVTQEEQGRIGSEMQSELWNVMVCLEHWTCSTRAATG